MTLLSLTLPTIVIAAIVAHTPLQEGPAGLQPGPETFAVKATASVQGEATGTVTVSMTIQIDRYTPEFARTAMTDALKYRGYPGFVQALREAPVAGTLEAVGRKFVIRWAHQEPADKGRTITLVTEKPVFFLGSGAPDAKPTAGYEVAVVKLTVDESGSGEGTMAAAARVKPRDVTGIEIDDYAQAPLKLAPVTRITK